MKFIFKEAESSNIVTAILNTTQRPSRALLTSFRPRVTSDKPFNYHFGCLAALEPDCFEPKMLQTPKW